MGQNDQCTAVVRDGESPPNVLFTPPCDCPRCKPDRVYDRATGREWLRVAGRQQRHRVELVKLGRNGRAVLG